MKKVVFSILFFLVIGFVLYFSIFDLKKEDVVYESKKDVALSVEVDNYDLNVTFYGGNLIKDEISYGNKIEKIIKIENPYQDVVVVALSSKDTYISNDYLTYNLSYSDKYDGNYTEILKGAEFKPNMNLGYNLGIEKSSSVYFKLEIIANLEEKVSKVESKIDIVSNLTKKELFLIDVDKIIKNLEDKISSLNGIATSGYFYYTVDDNIKGNIIIDATDITDLKFNLNLYNKDLCVKNVKYRELSKKKIQKFDKDFKDKLTVESACKLITKRNCLSFSEVKYNPKGGKDTFYDNVLIVIDNAKKTYKKQNKNVVYKLDEKVAGKTGITGYILISSKDEMYLYIRNDLFMISGYNYTKYKDNFSTDSGTIRPYTSSTYTAYENAAKDEKTVCNFSGFKDCYDASGNKL